MLRRLFPNVYEGWLVVGASAFIVLLIGASFFYGFGTIFNEVIDEFGWSVAATSIAFSLRSEVGGLAAPFVGNLIDRFGTGAVIFGGVIVTVLGVLAMSMIQTIWHFYGSMVVLAIGTSAAGGQAGMVAVASWFEARRATALAIMTVGGGLGGLFVVFVAWLVEQLGWRDALRAIALIMLVFGLLVALNVRDRPADHPQPIDGRRRLDALGAQVAPAVRWGIPWREAIRTRAAVVMSLAMMALSFGTTGVVIHLIPYVEREFDLSKSAAGGIMAFFTLSSILGRLGFGVLADRFPKGVMLAVATGFVVAGLPLLAFAPSTSVVLVASLLIATGFGGSIPVRPALLADYFGTRYFGTINGMSALVLTTGGAIGPWAIGWLVDLTGGYQAGWLVALAVTAAALPLFLMMRAPTELVAHYREHAVAEESTLLLPDHG